MSQVPERSKTSVSGLEFRVLSRELARALDGAYVSNIYSVGESQLFRMRRPAKDGGEPSEVSLVVSPRLGAWLTERPARVETTEFTTALRSRVLRARLTRVEQVDLDRVLLFTFEGKEEGPSKLVLELMPPGNLVLVGPDGKVALALREARSGARRVARGSPYSPPAQSRASLETLTRDGLERALAGEETLGRALGRGLSIPRRYVDEILARASRRQDDPPSGTPEEADSIAAAVEELLGGIESAPYPCLVRTEAGGVEVMVSRPRSARVLEESPDLSPLLDKALYPELIAQEEGNAARALREGSGESSADASERRAREYQATISGLEAKKAGLSKLSADLRGVASSAGGAPDGEGALEVARVSGVVPRDLLASLEGTAGKGPASVRSALFDRAKAAEREMADIDEAVRGLQSKLKREGARREPPGVRAISISRAKREWYEKFRWFFTTGGKLAIGGRDAQSNTALIRRHLQPGDTVYHADLFGSPFFVLKGGSDQSEEEVREVARATVTFSSAWKTGLGAADAYWVSPEQVSSAAPTGEYLAHGSFAIKGRKNFVAKSPVELAVGIDESGRVVSGPEESVMKVARGYVTMVPSREKPSDTAKKVLHELEPFVEGKPGPGVDDVLRMLPAGGGKIVRRRTDKRAG